MANFRMLDEKSLSHQHPAERSPQPTVAAVTAATATAEHVSPMTEPVRLREARATTVAGGILSPAEHPPPSPVATASTVSKPTKAAAKRTADGDDVDSKHFNDHIDVDYGGSVGCATLCLLVIPVATHCGSSYVIHTIGSRSQRAMRDSDMRLLGGYQLALPPPAPGKPTSCPYGPRACSVAGILFQFQVIRCWGRPSTTGTPAHLFWLGPEYYAVGRGLWRLCRAMHAHVHDAQVCTSPQKLNCRRASHCGGSAPRTTGCGWGLNLERRPCCCDTHLLARSLQATTARTGRLLSRPETGAGRGSASATRLGC